MEIPERWEREGRGRAGCAFDRSIHGNRSEKRRLFLTGASVAVLTALWATSAAAQTWTGATSNDWTTGSNWSTGTVPAGGAVVINPNSANPVLGLTGPATATTGNITIGQGGAASLTIQNGSVLTSTGGSLNIGGTSGTSSSVTVTGAGSQWNAVGVLIVGSGTNILNIENGGTVVATQALRLGPTAGSADILNISSGTLDTARITVGTASQANFDNAIVRATATNASWITSTGIMNIAAGGLTIDSAGFNVGTTSTSAFSGVGGLTKIGNGTLTLSANNTYGDETAIQGGTLALTGTGSISSSSRVVDNAAFDISGLTGSGTSIQRLAGSGTVALGTKTLTITNANDTFAGTFLGSGGLTLASGTETLTGDSSSGFTGITNIDGGTLAGTATVGSVNVNNGGTLAPGIPGTPGGTFNIAGNLTFATAASYLVNVSPTTTSLTKVTGTATLAGTIGGSATPGAYTAGTRYTVLTANGGTTGTFANSTLSTTFGSMTPVVQYDGNNVYLLLKPASLTNNLPPGTSQNATNVATGISNGNASTPTPALNFQNLFGYSPGQLQSGLPQLDGEAATGAERASFELTNAFLRLLTDPLDCQPDNMSSLACERGVSALPFASDQQTSLPPDIALAYAAILNKAPPAKPAFEPRWTAWGSGFGGGSFSNGNTMAGSSNVTTNIYGVASGLDYHFTPNTLAGFALSGAGTNWRLANALGSGRSDAFQVAVRGTSWFGPVYVNGAAAFANHWFTTDRIGLADQLRASFAGQSYSGRFETGYRYAMMPALSVIPYAAAQAQALHTPSYNETDLTGGGFGLSYAAVNATDVRTELGWRFDAPTLFYGTPLIVRGRLAWAHDFVSDPSIGALFEQLPGSNFTVNGAPIPHDSALTSLGAQLFMTPNWTLLAKFDGEFASASQTYAGSATLRYTW